VLLVNDQLSGVGATLEKSRLQGILAGTPNGTLVLKYVMKDEKVVPGETVMTSGGDRIFPKGLPIGKVAESTGGKDMFLDIRVTPGANLSKLEEVLVVTKVVERQRTNEETNGPVKASDILAERLPSVPQKPVDPNMKLDANGKPIATAPNASKPDNPTPAATTTTPKPAVPTKPKSAASNEAPQQ
jgi:rod shape-determining protein MreC